jgi:hypothetical protein
MFGVLCTECERKECCLSSGTWAHTQGRRMCKWHSTPTPPPFSPMEMYVVANNNTEFPESATRTALAVLQAEICLIFRQHNKCGPIPLPCIAFLHLCYMLRPVPWAIIKQILSVLKSAEMDL